MVTEPAASMSDALVRPTVSVLMPARNVRPYIAEAIASILCQDMDAWELIVIDDGSTDGTADEARRQSDPRIRVLCDGRHLGRSARLNQGVALARGRYIARMDADDVAYPGRLRRQAEHLDAHPSVDLVSNHMLVITTDGDAVGTLRWRGGSHEEIVAHPQAAFHFGQGTCMGRAEWFAKWPYDVRRRRAEDDDQMLRSYRSSRFERLPEILYAYRKPTPSLRSLAVARWDYARSLASVAVSQREPVLLVGIARQVVLLTMEAIVALPGLRDLWLRRRLYSADPDHHAEWAGVRRRISDRLDEVGPRPAPER